MNTLPRIIAITGGIGSGKSVVSRLLRVMGYTVYDCDERAKYVMTADTQLRDELTAIFGPDTYLTTPDGSIILNKPYLSGKIFGDSSLLSKMNACVHPAVARDLLAMAAQLPCGETFFFESAILYESGFDLLVPPDEVWTVSAPFEMRVTRAMQRDGATRDKILSRIASQISQEEKEQRASAVIYNDDRHSIIQQVKDYVSNF